MTKRAEIEYIKNDFNITELDHKSWTNAESVKVETYWTGEEAPEGRGFRASLLWSDTALYVRFGANQTEPLVVSENPNLDTKALGLWDRDVCELFINPREESNQRYFEFEVAPTGEWVDLEVHQLPESRETDWDFDSGMKTAARIEVGRVIMAFKIDWAAFGSKPKTGDVWVGNLFRAVGKEETRGYLAWSPTLTESPDFHVPEKFGEFVFIV